ncbi:AbrB/MazE/SpoVT family DNA-binding domain-containing protein, partial [uncultured Clostridium sp.]
MERKFDKLGRVVIPIEFRNALGLKEKDRVEIFLLQDGIFVKKV